MNEETVPNNPDHNRSCNADLAAIHANLPHGHVTIRLRNPEYARRTRYQWCSRNHDVAASHTTPTLAAKVVQSYFSGASRIYPPSTQQPDMGSSDHVVSEKIPRYDKKSMSGPGLNI